MQVSPLQLLIGFFIVVAVISVLGAAKKSAQLKRYTRITLGMSEAEMLKIMGGGYNKSLLKNNRVKYEWRINATSTSHSSGGIRYGSYRGVQKVDIYLTDGFVEEVRPYNVG